MSSKITPPSEAIELIQMLEAAGEECWVVGGCVRDSLMGKIPFDWDMTTSATPQKMQEIFSQEKLLLTGLSHGTVSVVRGKNVYEITTFRIESGCSDHRHPDSVQFTNKLEEDLARRDFTVNAMAYHPQRGLVDVFGGQKDLQEKIIRSVGNPKRRFEEDALRILRALRFSAVLGFEVERENARAAEQKVELLQEISAERILTEITKLLAAPFAKKSLSVCARVWNVIFSELQFLTKGLSEIESLPQDPFLRLIWLYQKENKSAVTALKRLKAPKAEQNRAKSLFELQTLSPNTCIQLRKAMHRWGEDAVLDYVELNPKVPTLRQEFCKARNGVWNLSQLPINGNDLILLGAEPGKQVGSLLNTLLVLCMEGKIENQKEILALQAKALLAQNRE